MSGIGAPEIILIILAILLLFGYKKLPEASRSLGRSMRIFKSETKGLRSGDDSPQPTLAESDAAREAREFEEWKATRTDRTETR